eukprot:m.142202 g.142202  ORF g.142202 m.142202 type:complete len:734 (-) comp14052_c0_seq1:249-2450(-)
MARRGGIVPFKVSHRATSWEPLRLALVHILGHQGHSAPFDELYRYSYYFCIDAKAKELYQHVFEELKSQCQQILTTLRLNRQETVLSEVSKAYQRYFLAMLKLKDIFMYLDNNYSDKFNHPRTFELGLTCFRTEVLMDVNLNTMLRAAFLEALNSYRRTKQPSVPVNVLKSISSMLIQVGDNDKHFDFYDQTVQQKLLTQAQDFHLESAGHFQSCSTSEYLQFLLQRLDFERTLVLECLDEQTMPKLKQIVMSTLLEPYITDILSLPCGFSSMIDVGNHAELSNMYILYHEIADGPKVLLKAFRQHVEHLASTALAATALDPKAAVPAMMKLVGILQKMSDISETCFQKNSLPDELFLRAIASGFNSALVSCQHGAEYLARAFDDILKNSEKTMTGDEARTSVKELMRLFKMLDDRDIFERYYKQQLARRLLLNKSASDELERFVLQLLRAECGHSFTQKLEGMFKDTLLAPEINSNFADHAACQRLAFKMEVQVLTTGYWPFTPNPTAFNLPPVLLDACSAFESCYLSQHSGRKLTWDPTFGSAELLFTPAVSKKRLTLVAYPLQMAVLLQFNRSSTHTLRSLLDATQAAEADIKTCLKTLAGGKTRVLKKVDPTPKIGMDDKFIVYEKLNPSSARVKLPQVYGKAQRSADRKDVTARTQVDRAHAVEAAIVRVMKARKTLEHQPLVAEVIKQLSVHFQPTPQLIKQRIERLIDGEFLERSATSRTLYSYLA